MTSIRYEDKTRCYECGQDISETGVCTRCDEICSNCKEKRKDHIVIDGGRYLACSTSSFSGSGELKS